MAILLAVHEQPMKMRFPVVVGGITPSRKRSIQATCALRGGAAAAPKRRCDEALLPEALLAHLDADVLSSISPFLSTKDILTASATSRALNAVLPRHVATVELAGTKALINPAFLWALRRRFGDGVRRLQLRNVTLGTPGGLACSLRGLAVLLSALPHLEEVEVLDERLGSMASVLQSGLGGKVRRLCLSSGSGMMATSPAAAPQPPRVDSTSEAEQQTAVAAPGTFFGARTLPLARFFALRGWPCLTELELTGDWFDELGMRAAMASLAAFGTLGRLERLVVSPLFPHLHADSASACASLAPVLTAALAAHPSCLGQLMMQQLHLRDAVLTGESGAALMRAVLQLPSLKDLSLENCRLDDDLLRGVATALLSAPISRLSLHLTALQGRSAGVRELAAALASSKELRARLESVSLRRAHRLHPQDVAALLAAMAEGDGDFTNLRELDLSENVLTSGATPALVALLRKCPRLERLDLSHNALNDAAAKLLAHAVQQSCPRLRNLCVGGNRFGDVGAVALVTAVLQSPEMRAVDLAAGAPGVTPPGVHEIHALLSGRRGSEGRELRVVLSQAVVAWSLGFSGVSESGQVQQRFRLPHSTERALSVDARTRGSTAALVAGPAGQCVRLVCYQ